MNIPFAPASDNLLPPLETFDSPISKDSNNAVIKIIFPEFTCLCPKTGYPDFASIELYYLPKNKCLELKSWKLYLNAFRNIGTFHEAVINRIFNTLNEILEPQWLRIVGDFFPRGNVNTTVCIETETPAPRCVEYLFESTRSHARTFQ